MRRLFVTTCALVALGLSVGLAQQQPPPRDTRAAGATGTAGLGGTIVTDEQPSRPLAFAHVGVLGVDSGLIRVTSSNQEGRFQIQALPAGRYLVAALKAPFVAGVFGARAAGRPGTAVALAQGEQRTNLVLRLVRGAVITGVVTDGVGAPVVGIGVTVMPASGASLQTQMMASAFLPPQITDDRGAYRFSGLLPGEYVVTATRPDRIDPEARTIAAEEIDEAMRLIREAQTSSATIGAADPAPVSRGRGAFPDGFPMPMMLSAMMMTSGSLRYAPVHYPGTVDAADARPVNVAAGEERGGIDIVAPAVPTSKIEGIVVGPDGQPAPNASLRLRSSGPVDLMSFLRSFAASSPQVNKDGVFALNGIAPGRYTLEARTYAQGVNPAMIAAGASAGFTPPKPQLFASTDVVVVSGQPLTGVELRLQSGSQVTGRVVFRPTRSEPPKDASAAVVSLSPAAADDPLSMISNGIARPAPDGTFSLQGVIPGRYVITVGITDPAQLLNWMPESVTIDGRETLDVPIEVRSGEDIRNVVVTLGDVRQEVAGTLQDAAGRPAPDFTILLFATDRAYWIPNSRRVLATRPATDGRFSFAGPLGPAPGEYYLAALTDLDPRDQYSPAILAEISAAAIRLTVGKGGTTRQDIRIAK